MKSKKLKKLIAMAIVAGSITATVPIGMNSNVAFASEVTYIDELAASNDGFSVEPINDGTEYEITSFDSSKIGDGDIKIPSQIGGKSVTSIGNSAFSGCSGLTSIIIPNSVTSIGNTAFMGCVRLKSIDIQGSIVGIGFYAFKNINNSAMFYVPDSTVANLVGQYKTGNIKIVIGTPNEFAGGDGTQTNPYLVSNEQQLNNVRNHISESKYFKQTADITLTTDWNPIGDNANEFLGFYDGQNCKINNLNITNSTSNYMGLFGDIADGSTIENLHIVSSNVTGQSFVGILAGYNGGVIENCSASGTVDGVRFVGGLVGNNSGTIKASYSNGMISATDDDQFGTVVGGLVGSNDYSIHQGIIENSYSTADVTATSTDTVSMGGLVGENSMGFIRKCYSSGKVTCLSVPSISNIGGLVGDKEGVVEGTAHEVGNFYNQTTSLQNDAGDGIMPVVSNDAMRMGGTFGSFDFTSGTIWKIDSGATVSYPYLANNEQIPHPGATQVAGATNITEVSDIADNADGRDLQVKFNKAVDESLVGSYRIMVVKAANAGSFDLTAANAVIAGNYTEVAKTGANITQVLATGAKDTDGDTIHNGQAYKVFVLSVADGSTATVNALSAAPTEITLQVAAYIATASILNPTPTVVAGVPNSITLTVKDSSGNTDMSFSGPKNVTVSGYTVAPKGTYGSFTSIIGMGPGYFIGMPGMGGMWMPGTPITSGGELTPTSMTIQVNFTSGVGTVSLGLYNAQAQNISFNVSGVNIPDTNNILITPVANSAREMALVQDITAPTSNGGKFAQQPIIELKDQYGNLCINDSSTRITVSKGDGGTWLLAGGPSAIAVAGRATFTDLRATNSAEVNGAKLSFSANGCPLISSSVVTLPAGAVLASIAPTVNDITVTNNNLGTDDTIVVSGLSAGDIVKVYDAATGNTVIGTATVLAGETSATITTAQLGVPAGNVYVSVTSTGKSESTRTQKAYVAEALPAGSVNITEVSDIADNADGRDLQVKFNKAADESLVGSYRIMAVKTSKAANFNLAAANAVAAGNYTEVAKTGANITQALATGAKDTDGDAIHNGQAYKVFVVSVADGTNAIVNTLSTASTEITLQGAAQSNACDITTWTAPAMNGTTASKTVPNGKTSLVVYVAVSANATWKLYSDPACSAEITNRTMPLNVGLNTAYVEVTAEDGTTKTYTVIITREAAAPTVAVSNLAFIDTDNDANQIGGTLTWTPPADVSNVTSYSVYASADGIIRGTQIGTDVPVGTNQLVIPANTEFAPHIIVVAKNAVGEATSANYASTSVTDVVPTSAPQEGNIIVTNNTGEADTIGVINVPQGATVKVYDALTGGNEIGTAVARADGTATINCTLAPFGGNVYVTIIEQGKTESTPRTVKAYVAEPLPKYTLSFDTMGGNTVAPISGLEPGHPVTLPQAPTRAGYEFAGWYTDSSCTTPFNPSNGINQNTTVYVKWTQNAKIVTIVSSLPDITVPYGTAYNDIQLPGIVTLTLSDSTTTSAAVIWSNQGSEYDGNAEGTYTLKGTLQLPNGITNPNSVVARVKVRVSPLAKVKLTESSLGIAGDGKIIGLTSGNKYKVRIGDLLRFVKANGRLSSVGSEVAPLEGTEITGLTNGTIYNVQECTTTQAAATYTLNYTAGEGGKVTGDLSQTVNSGEDGSEVTAVPNENYHFVKWSDGKTNARRKDINVDADIEVHAIFEADTTNELGIPKGIMIKGTKEVGNTLSAEFIDKDGNAVTTSASVTYEWYRSSSDSETGDLVGNDATYQLTSSDAGKYINLLVLFDDKKLKASTSKIIDTTSHNSSKSKDKSNNNEIKVNVTDGSSNNSVSQTVIERTNAEDGTKKDNIDYTESKAQQTVDALKNEGKDVARIVIPDTNDEVSEDKVNISTATISVLSKGNVKLEIDTENARISLPKESIQDLSQNGTGQVNGDLYFRLVPVKDEKKQEEIETRANQEKVVKEVSGNSNVQVVGRPMEIETNMSQRPVDIVLPLKNVDIPSDPAQREAFLKDLGIFIEHSDGEKVLTKAEIVEYEPGVLGLKFTVNKFSTFTIVKLNQQATNNKKTGWELTNGDWYFYKKDGTKATGWYKSEIRDWSYKGKDIEGTWFYLDANGKMNLGWFKDTDGSWYLLCDGKLDDALGVMQTGWKFYDGKWYFLKDNGVMATGWQQVKGKWYYLYEDGSMASNTEVNGYKVDESGAWIG